MYDREGKYVRTTKAKCFVVDCIIYMYNDTKRYDILRYGTKNLPLVASALKTFIRG